MKNELLQDLLSQMSLEEKIGQLVQLPASFLSEGNLTGPALEMGLTRQDIRLAGSVLSVIGAEKICRIQKEYMENHPHHIPLLFMADIINGYRTVFPIPLAQGCSFDPGLAEKCAAIAAEEAAASGIHVTFSPMADLSRDPRWGRVMEGTGEDPCLNRRMAAALVRGYQGEESGPIGPGRLASCLKHFAGYGAPVAGRDYNTVELSPRTLREDYLPAYQGAVDAGCALVMTSFNTLDRIPSAANRWLLQDILRREMGFDGVIISDWAALHELLAHGVASDHAEAALKAITAGVDIDMASPVYCRHLKELVEKGLVPVSLIDEAALRVLQLKNRLGLFENPFKDADTAAEKEKLLSPAHRAAARECAEKTFVLLKNEDALLPIHPDTSIACIGPYVDNRLLDGSWSFFADDQDTATLREALTQAGCRASFAPGCSLLDPGTPLIAFQKKVSPDTMDSEQALQEALALARRSEKVILALGEPRDFSGEAASRADLSLPDCQLDLLRQISAVNPQVIVLLFCGRPLDLRPVQKYARAILLAWMPGTEGAHALAGILTGRAAPSGKLAMSFPRGVGQVPVHYAHLNTGRPFHGDYRTERFFSKYLDIPNDPLYPFGFGLTYTRFAYSPVVLDRTEMKKDETLHASVTLTNTGSRAGTETVQLYIRDVSASVARPVRELKDFRKVTLNPGESREVTFAVSESQLRFYTLDMHFASEPGDFEIYIGSDSTAQNCASFRLTE